MVGPIVPTYQILQDGDKIQRVLHREITIKPLFQRSIEPFHHTGFRVATGRKMMNVLLRHQGLKRLVVKFFPIIRLKIHGFSPLTAFQDLGHGVCHCLSRLALHGFDPGPLRKHVHYHQEISVPSIVLGNVDHLDQISRPSQTPSRVMWEIDAVSVCATCTPNHVARPRALVGR